MLTLTPRRGGGCTQVPDTSADQREGVIAQSHSKGLLSSKLKREQYCNYQILFMPGYLECELFSRAASSIQTWML